MKSIMLKNHSRLLSSVSSEWNTWIQHSVVLFWKGRGSQRRCHQVEDRCFLISVQNMLPVLLCLMSRETQYTLKRYLRVLNSWHRAPCGWHKSHTAFATTRTNLGLTGQIAHRHLQAAFQLPMSSTDLKRFHTRMPWHMGSNHHFPH